MKYIIGYCVNEEEKKLSIDFYGTTTRRLFKKAAVAVCNALWESGAVAAGQNIEYRAEMPNIWTNGGVGAIWLYVAGDLFTDVTIRRKGCNGFIAL